MNKRERQVLKTQLEREAKLLKDLERRYTLALKDVRKDLRGLVNRPETASVVRQIEFQSALQDRLQTVVGALETDAYKNIESFLEDSYANGWNGAFYSMDGQGVNLNIALPTGPINIINDTAGGIPLSRRIHSSVENTRERIADELTRGLAQGRGFNEISRNLANVTGLGYRDAQRIGRTEGHRVYQRSTYDAQRRAKAEGADVKKQWDATLDGKTRRDHQAADGQLRDIDEPFDVGGEQLMYPGGEGGSARNTINCRCVSLQRASWALDRKQVSDYNARSFEDYKNDVN